MMNLPKPHSFFTVFRRLYEKDTVSKSCFCENYSTIFCNRFKVSEIVSLNPKQFNYCLCTTNENKCWSCGSSVSTIFCKKCKSLQRVKRNSNYFDLMGLNYTFDLKLSELTKNYRGLQSILHPDKFGNKSEEEKNISEEYSSLINKAYSTLNQPIERGLYMLKLKGHTIEEGTTQVDPAFFMEIMERNEELENENDGKKLSEYNRINKESMSVLTRKLLEAFQKDDITSAKEILTKLKYYSSIDSKIKERKQCLGIPD